MALKEKLDTDSEQLPEWMSTHPDSNKRAEHLDFLLPQVNIMRTKDNRTDKCIYVFIPDFITRF